MKKFLLAILAVLVAGSPLLAQHLLSDAKILRDAFSVPAADGRMSLKRGLYIDEDKAAAFQKYLPADAVLSDATLQAAFSGNPFLRVEITDQNFADFKSNKTGGGGATGGGAPSYGFSVAGFADGFARFLVKRTKQELAQSFFRQFKDAVEKEAILGQFCPATKAHLAFIDRDIYQFNNYLEGLRESFVMDMAALPGSTESFLRTNYSQKEEGKVAIDLLHLSQQMVDGERPVDMIDYLARPGSAIQTATKAEPVMYDIASGFKFMRLVSESLRNPASKDSLMPWYSGRELREAFQDPVLLRIYMGLLWQNAQGIDFTDAGGSTLDMRAVLGKAAKADGMLQTWKQSIEDIGEGTHSMQLAVKAGSTTPSSVSDDYYRYAQSLVDLLQRVNRVGRTVFGRTSDLIPNKYILLLRQCNSLYFNVRQRNYTGAIGNVIYCLNMLGQDKQEVKTLLKYANFAASIAEANSPEEMERALEMFALPPGSSKMKKQPGRFSVALNAYTGVGFGKEYLDDLNGGRDVKRVRALSAPIGLSGSWGLGVGQRSWGSLGFFVPVLDIGAVTAYRFNANNAAPLPELTWGNILAPGFYAVYGLPWDLPIAVGYGAQVGPALRKVTNAQNVEVNRSGWRQGFFLSVDIPIAYFYLGKGKP